MTATSNTAADGEHVCELCDSDRPGAYRLPDGTILCKSHAFNVWKNSGKDDEFEHVDQIVSLTYDGSAQ